MVRKGRQATTMAALAKLAPYAEELAQVRTLLDQFNDAVLATVMAGGTDKESLAALVGDLREMVEGWR